MKVGESMGNKKILIGMILINLISIISGFLRDSSIVIALGATEISDIFMFIINLPTVLFSSIGWVIMSTFLPTYVDLMVNKGKDIVNNFTNTFIKCIVIISSLFVVVLLIFNKVSINILAPGFKGEAFLLTKELFFIMVPSLIFLSISSCFSAILNANKKMLWVSLMGIPINIMTIFSMILVYPNYGIKYSTLVVLLGTFLQVLIFVIPLRKINFRFNKKFDIKDENIKKLIYIIGPMFIGIMAQQINSMFGGAITSTLEAGSLTAYNLSNKIVNAVYSSIILIAINYIFTYLSHDYANGEINKFNRKISSSANMIILVLLPLTLLLIKFNQEIISLLYGYGNFSRNDVLLTSRILIFSSIGIIFMGIRELINRSYYSTKETKIPTIYSIIGIGFNILLSLILCRRFGVLGVALAGSLSIVISAIGICYKFQKDFNTELVSFVSFIKYLGLTLVMYFIISFLKEVIQFNMNYIVNMFIIGVISLFLYIILLFIFRIRIIDYIKEL